MIERPMSTTKRIDSNGMTKVSPIFAGRGRGLNNNFEGIPLDQREGHWLGCVLEGKKEIPERLLFVPQASTQKLCISPYPSKPERLTI